MCRDCAAQINKAPGVQSPTRPLKRRNSSPPPAIRVKVPKSEVKLVINRACEGEEQNYGEKGYLHVEDRKLIRGKYRIIKHIGTGGFGSVYMGRVVRTKKIVAVKIARCGEICNSFSQRELEFTKAAEGSSNVLNVIDSFSIRGPHGSHFVMVFEMLGPDLFHVLTRSNQKKLTVDRLRKFCRDILNGLDHLHTKCGILHLDLKPENLLMTIGDEEPGQDSYNIDLSDPSCPASLKIADLGLAAWTFEDVTRQVQNCEYRAPESFLGEEIKAATDMWSFGAIAYEMATGRELFPCDHKRCPTDFEGISDLMSYIIAKIQPAAIQERSQMDEYEAKMFSNLLTRVLRALHDSRLTAKEALEHPFLKD